MTVWPFDDGEAWRRHGNPLFGEEGWSNTPAGEMDTAYYVPTPIGDVCWLCEERVVDGDAGELMLFPTAKTMGVRVLHRECKMLNMFGHEVRLCSCTDYGGLSIRAAALECARRFGG